MLPKVNLNLIKDLKKQKRKNSSLLFLDNVKIIKDAINYGLKPLYIFVDKEDLNIWGNTYPVFKVDKQTIDQLSDSKTPQGVICIAEYTQHIVDKPKNNFLVLDKLQDPGNVGTLIRTAVACGFNDIYLLDSVNINNSKLIRSSVGTIFKCNIYSLSEEKFIELAKSWKLSLIKTVMDGDNIFNIKFSEQVGVVVGNEGQGISNKISEICKYKVKIPMKPFVESLNASVSGAVIMYEIAKNSF